MANPLTRAELSKLEGITNPTRSPEEMKCDDFEGDMLNVFQYNMKKNVKKNLKIQKSRNLNFKK